MVSGAALLTVALEPPLRVLMLSCVPLFSAKPVLAAKLLILATWLVVPFNVAVPDVVPLSVPDLSVPVFIWLMPADPAASATVPEPPSVTVPASVRAPLADRLVAEPEAVAPLLTVIEPVVLDRVLVLAPATVAPLFRVSAPLVVVSATAVAVVVPATISGAVLVTAALEPPFRVLMVSCVPLLSAKPLLAWKLAMAAT